MSITRFIFICTFILRWVHQPFLKSGEVSLPCFYRWGDRSSGKTPPEEKRGQNLNPVQILKSALSPPFCGQNQLSREFAIEGPPWAGPFPTRARIYSLQGGKPLSKMKKWKFKEDQWLRGPADGHAPLVRTNSSGKRDVVCPGAVRGAVLKFLESTNTRQTVSEEESYL